MSDLKERVEVLLNSLGDDADAVAASLRMDGIKGHRDDGCACPIAMLLANAIPEATYWNSDNGWFVDLASVRWPAGAGEYEDIDPPLAVRRFIDAFDAGRYPELDVERQVDE